jgi:Protein of unknown function (DUF3151)
VTHDNLLGDPAETLLPTDPAQALLDSGQPAQEVVRAYPASSVAWAMLAEGALDEGRDVDAYAYARVGYHRGLDSLRRNGWRGHGPVPYSHLPNRGFLRALSALGKASARIGDTDEANRCRDFLFESSPEAAQTLA